MVMLGNEGLEQIRMREMLAPGMAVLLVLAVAALLAWALSSRRETGAASHAGRRCRRLGGDPADTAAYSWRRPAATGAGGGAVLKPEGARA